MKENSMNGEHQVIAVKDSEFLFFNFIERDAKT